MDGDNSGGLGCVFAYMVLLVTTVVLSMLYCTDAGTYLADMDINSIE
jgi:hypothetical protein